MSLCECYQLHLPPESTSHEEQVFLLLIICCRKSTMKAPDRVDLLPGTSDRALDVSDDPSVTFMCTADDAPMKGPQSGDVSEEAVTAILIP
jgi:hypothetical protein